MRLVLEAASTNADRTAGPNRWSLRIQLEHVAVWFRSSVVPCGDDRPLLRSYFSGSDSLPVVAPARPAAAPSLAGSFALAELGAGAVGRREHHRPAASVPASVSRDR